MTAQRPEDSTAEPQGAGDEASPPAPDYGAPAAGPQSPYAPTGYPQPGSGQDPYGWGQQPGYGYGQDAYGSAYGQAPGYSQGAYGQEGANAQAGYPTSGYQQPGGYPGSGYGYGYPSAPPSRQTEGKAVPALVLAICAWVFCPVVLAIAALVMARQSTRAIEASGGRLDGASMNAATKWVAWINIVLWGIGILLMIAFFAFVTTTPGFWDEVRSGVESGLNDGTQF